MAVELAPLPYHLTIADRLASLEPRAWSLFADAVRQSGSQPGARPAPAATPDAVATEDVTATGEVSAPSNLEAVPPDELEAMLVRHAYRMEEAAHPRVHAAARRAADVLGVPLPISIYQLEGPEHANAALAYRPHEAVFALSGNLLALLTDDELVACFGHELAHHVLWSALGGRILTADRFLVALSLDPSTPPAYLETARRFDLATELFADRGSLAACGSLDIAIASLVKVATGLTEVDPQAFLRQAEAARPDRGTEGTSHPETVLRAWALARHQAGDGTTAAETLLAPVLDIERLDILDRERLETLTRTLIADVLRVEWMRTDAVVAHAGQFHVDTRAGADRGRGWRDRARTEAATTPVETRVPVRAPAETRRFLAYVLLDLATVDPDLDDEPLVETLAVAREAGIAAMYEEVARKELAPSTKAWDGLQRRAAERRLATVTPAPDAPPPATEPAP